VGVGWNGEEDGAATLGAIIGLDEPERVPHTGTGSWSTTCGRTETESARHMQDPAS
jgi:hypothetical protein